MNDSMKDRMRRTGLLAFGLLLSVSFCLVAGPVSVPNTFTAGTPARASEVNANFTAVADAVNDNNSRVAALEAGAAAPDLKPSGNLVLMQSTPSAGSILKGTSPFIHDFGEGNAFIGLNAGNLTMTGHDNTASGADALQANEDGSQNTASGRSALARNTSGFSNTASGANALFSNTTGNRNTAIGETALGASTSGTGNTAIGSAALAQTTSADGNIAIGRAAGVNLRTGSNNIVIGHTGVFDESNTTRIGSTQTRAFMAGIRGITTANANGVNVVVDSAGQLGTVNSSRRVKDRIDDMGAASSLLMRLRPVTFYYKSDENPEGRSLQYGLIAEEVADVAPDLVARSRDGDIETVFYQFLPPMLLNEYQKQQRTIEAQNARIAELEQLGQKQELKIQRQSARLEAVEGQRREFDELKQQTAHIAAVLSRMHAASAAKSGRPADSGR